MTEIKGNLLHFDVVDVNGNLFPKHCKIRLPGEAPILWQNERYNPDSVLGLCTNITRGNKYIAIQGYLNDDPAAGEILKKLLKEGSVLYFGGYYRAVKSHKEGGVRVIDSMDLVSVGVYPSSVFGDDSLRLEIVEK